MHAPGRGRPRRRGRRSLFRTGVIAPFDDKLDLKLMAVGLPSCDSPEGYLSKALLALVGVLEIILALNNWAIKSPTLALFLAIIGLPGFALASYAHLEIGEPVTMSIPIYVLMICLAITALTSDVPTKKLKEK